MGAKAGLRQVSLLQRLQQLRPRLDKERVAAFLLGVAGKRGRAGWGSLSRRGLERSKQPVGGGGKVRHAVNKSKKKRRGRGPNGEPCAVAAKWMRLLRRAWRTRGRCQEDVGVEKEKRQKDASTNTLKIQARAVSTDSLLPPRLPRSSMPEPETRDPRQGRPYLTF